MPFDTDHLYLTIHWSDSRDADEGGQVGIRFDAVEATVTQAMVDACKPAVETFWLSAGANIANPYVLRYLRLAAISTTGQYVPDSFSRDATYTNGVANTHSYVPLPMQIASVATLTTARPRGQASHGRIYLPPFASALGVNGRWTAALVDARATALATMINSLNQALRPVPGGLPSVASVFSKGTTKSAAGLHEFITGVKIGTRPDVQRRRAKGMAEEYGATKVVTVPVP